MLNRKLVIIISISMLFLFGCNKIKHEEKPEEIKSIEYFLEMSKEMSDMIYSNSSMKELENYFKDKEKNIDEGLYKEKFDLSNSLNTLFYQRDYTIENKNILRIYADTIQELGVVKVIVVSDYMAEPDYYYIDNEMEYQYIELFSDVVTEVFEYSIDSKKLIKYEKFG